MKKNINDYIKNNNDEEALEYKPLIFDLRNISDENKLKKLFEDGKISKVIDTYSDQINELEIVKDPKMLLQKNQTERDFDLTDGVWVYYSWKGCLVHVLRKDEYRTLRNSRNKNLILETEQKQFESFKIGIAGLNVGNPGAVCIALEGGASQMKFADFDSLSLSNLNRFRAGLCELEINKAILSARQVYEIDPFYEIELFEKGLNQDNIEQFLLNPKIDLLVEETDNLKLKIKIREQAKKNGIPVIMVTGNEENIIIDIERFDIDSSLPILNGYLKKEIIEKINDKKSEELQFTEKILLARDFMGKNHLTERLQESFLLLGTELAGIPQLAESSFLRGAAICYLARQISTGQNVPSGRYVLNLDVLK